MTTTKQYDNLNRLTSVSSVPSASSAVSFSYAYNTANQRVRTTEADGSYWSYDYDSLGQVTTGHKFWSDGSAAAGQYFDYSFDQIGNRTQTMAGGAQNGWNQRVATYTPNNLNQYSQRTVPGAVDIMGLSMATNPVTVNGTTAYRKGEYFRQQLPVGNGSTAAWTNIVVSAGGQSSVSGNQFVPKTPEMFLYDQDGNLTNDGHWTYTWDAENRLVSMVANTAVAPAQSLAFAYDWKGRRISKTVWSNLLQSGNPATSLAFVYDGWNLIAELNTLSSSPVRSYVWGSDISGSLQGAGGVGGLLEVSYRGAQTTNCFTSFDGNGNVVVLVSAADATLAAQYEYGPFGELLRATGPMAKANFLRFSTKYHDDESDLLYFGYRYYDANKGRWNTRDPVRDEGGALLYAYLPRPSTSVIFSRA